MLGGFAVTVRDAHLDESEWRRRQAAALVKILALTPNRALHRERVMDLLWPELSVDEAAPRLHKAAHYGRRTLGDSASLVLAGDLVALYPRANVRVDTAEFEELANLALVDRDRAAATRAATTRITAICCHRISTRPGPSNREIGFGCSISTCCGSRAGGRRWPSSSRQMRRRTSGSSRRWSAGANGTLRCDSSSDWKERFAPNSGSARAPRPSGCGTS